MKSIECICRAKELGSYHHYSECNVSRQHDQKKLLVKYVFKKGRTYQLDDVLEVQTDIGRHFDKTEDLLTGVNDDFSETEICTKSIVVEIYEIIEKKKEAMK